MIWRAPIGPRSGKLTFFSYTRQVFFFYVWHLRPRGFLKSVRKLDPFKLWKECKIWVTSRYDKMERGALLLQANCKRTRQNCFRNHASFNSGHKMLMIWWAPIGPRSGKLTFLLNTRNRYFFYAWWSGGYLEVIGLCYKSSCVPKPLGNGN